MNGRLVLSTLMSPTLKASELRIGCLACHKDPEVPGTSRRQGHPWARIPGTGPRPGRKPPCVRSAMGTLAVAMPNATDQLGDN